ncbi:MAG: hypothetical protein QOG94_522, partial [Solirubrobacteraceae bacterium]|nr:hypothetical protein [Solirubrobacteraceae bacterium]
MRPAHLCLLVSVATAIAGCGETRIDAGKAE